MRRALLLAVALLAGCGKQVDLRPADGHGLPPKPAIAATQPSVRDLLTPSTSARPPRSDELLVKSQERPDDRFNVPPR